ncbi:MAG: hypothetical protein LBQ02_04735, partial [Candidatus Nomurabacteria bacterium]|nr:hypothetical protein [Candidatus Nomurabacteria bacterium]
PENSNIGSYTLDIAYDETSNPAPYIPPDELTPTNTWVKAANSNTDAINSITGASTTEFTVDLDANMIPIVNKANDDTYPSSWCNYDAKQWCNAVTVTSSTLAQYQADPAGTVIAEDDILGYWTYIPRYEYQVCRPNASDSITLTAGQCQDGNGQDVLSTASPYLFNIQFQKSTQKTTYNGTTVGGWTTHPAFTLGTTELNGLWIGKFETSSSDSITSTATATSAVSAGHVYIKPNQNGLNYQNVSTEFTIAVNMGKNGDGTVVPTNSSQNTQNFNSFNARMSKNDDWGAIAYLSTSIYGRGTSEVYINNCYKSDNYNARTGWGAATANASSTTSCVPGTNDEGAYHTTQGQHASTTDNIYGIYDMSGGNYEPQMAVYSNTSGNPSPSSSGFSTFPDPKYYNLYNRQTTFTNNDYATNNNQCTWATCGGQALHEIKTVQSVSSYNQSWGGDYSYFVGAYSPWFIRGGLAINGSLAGLFSSDYTNGSANSSYGWRAVAGAY